MKESWRPNRDYNILTPLLWPSALYLSRSPDAQPEAQGLSFLLSAGFLYHILSATSLDPNSSGAPRAPSAWCGLSYHISSITPTVTPTVWILSWLSYIIVQRPLNLWNSMFDRHQAEITVMQFRGHSLPVYESMSVPWDFLPCPISSANFRPRDLFRLLAIGMCHFLPVHHFEWQFWPGRKSKYNTI